MTDDLKNFEKAPEADTPQTEDPTTLEMPTDDLEADIEPGKPDDDFERMLAQVGGAVGSRSALLDDRFAQRLVDRDGARGQAPGSARPQRALWSLPRARARPAARPLLGRWPRAPVQHQAGL